MKKSNESINNGGAGGKKVSFSSGADSKSLNVSRSSDNIPNDHFPSSNVMAGLVMVSASKPPLHPFYGDILYKMSKKIAQLTKVIYFLNNKYELHEKEVSHLELQHSNTVEKVSGGLFSI
jgi:hypothetical protein